MTNRLVRAVLTLYPRGFRRRYGPEIQDLVNELEAAGDRSRIRLVGGLLASAAAERLRAIRLDARLAIPTLAAVVALGTIMSVTSPRVARHHFPRAVANGGTYASLATTSSTATGPWYTSSPTGATGAPSVPSVARVAVRAVGGWR
jgi:hypothetical protein